MQQWRPHEIARIKSGKYADMAGEVVEVRPNTGMVRVKIQGVKNGLPFLVNRWFIVGLLERPQ